MSLSDVLESAGTAASSGAVTGGLLGGVGAALAGKRKLLEILKAAALGSGAYGGLAGGSVLTGSALMGSPKAQETTPYTDRGLLGGGVAGGILGATGGAALGAGVLPEWLKPTGKVGLSAALAKFGSSPSLTKALLGGLGGGIGLGAAGAVAGSDEGLQVDYLRQKMKEYKRQEIERMLGLT